MFELIERIGVLHDMPARKELPPNYRIKRSISTYSIVDAEYSAQTFYALERRGLVEGDIGRTKMSYEEPNLKNDKVKRPTINKSNVALTFKGQTAYQLTKDKFHRFLNLTKCNIKA